MILKNMLQFCKASKTIEIAFYGNGKYLSDGSMFAFIGDMVSDWKVEDIVTAMDLTAEEMDDYKTSTVEYGLSEVSEKCIKSEYALLIHGKSIQPFESASQDGKTLYIDVKRLRVFEDNRHKSFYFSSDGAPSLYIKESGDVIGIIPSEKIHPAEMKNFADMLKKSAEHSERTGYLAAGEQMSL